MSRWDCARCDWRPDAEADGRPRDQLVEHALDSGHPVCPCCHRSARHDDPVHGCEACLTAARRLLQGIATLYALLPAELARLRSGLGTYGGGGSTAPLPGGDALVLLGAGSAGLDEDGTTSAERDLPSVSFELGWWALEWQDTRGEYEEIGHRPTTIVRRACGYLERRARWAAEEHPGFPEFLGDLRRLYGALERATGNALRNAKANADCFDCGGRLLRVDDEDGGLSDVVSCERCRRTYTSEQYALALRAAYDSGLEGWVTFGDAAAATKRSVETFETWAKRGQLEVACRLSDRKRVVWWPSLQERLGQSRRRSA